MPSALVLGFIVLALVGLVTGALAYFEDAASRRLWGSGVGLIALILLLLPETTMINGLLSAGLNSDAVSYLATVIHRASLWSAPFYAALLAMSFFLSLHGRKTPKKKRRF